jgi:hypothetical protein
MDAVSEPPGYIRGAPEKDTAGGNEASAPGPAAGSIARTFDDKRGSLPSGLLPAWRSVGDMMTRNSWFSVEKQMERQ